MNWYTFAKKQEMTFIMLRRIIHENPELGNQEFDTSKRITEFLQTCGIETKKYLTTGVTGLVKGKYPGKTVMIRADMDALPIMEETDLSYQSKTSNVMHACGHDIHIAMALGAAKILSEHTDVLHGNILFVFQPDEEGEGGAERLIQKNILANVNAVYGIHVDPTLPAGTIGIKYGSFYAAAGKFDITVQGKSAHGAQREKGIDAINCAAEIITSINQMNGKMDDERIVATIGTIHAGNARNILCGQADMQGIIRTFGEERREKAHQQILHILEKADEKNGTRTKLHWEDGYCGIINHDAETKIAEEAAREMFPENTVILQEPMMTTEDFGYYLKEKQGCFYHLGVESAYPLHSQKFNPKENAIAVGIAMHCMTAEKYLNQK